MKDQDKAILLLVLTGVLWSIGGVIIKFIDWHPMAIAGGRSLITAVIIWAFFRREKLSFSRAQWGGALAYCCMLCFFVTATKLTTSANAILLQYTAPVYVALIGSWLLAEKATRRDWMTIGFIFFGILFFFLDKVAVGGMIGNMFALASGVSFAMFTVFMRMQKNGSPYGSILIGNILTFLVSLFFWSDVSFTLNNVAGITVLGTFQLGLPYILYSYAIKHIKALEATLITTVEPILNPVWVYIFYGEVPGSFSIIGGLIVIATLAVRYWFDAKVSQVCNPADKLPA